jgi:hypothetical protein
LLLLLLLFFCHPLQQLRLLLLLRYAFPSSCDVSGLTPLLLLQLLLHFLRWTMLLQMQRWVLMLCRMQRCHCSPLSIQAVHVFQDVLRTCCCHCMCCCSISGDSFGAELPLGRRLHLLLLLLLLLPRAAHAYRHVHMLLYWGAHLIASLLSICCVPLAAVAAVVSCFGAAVGCCI